MMKNDYPSRLSSSLFSDINTDMYNALDFGSFSLSDSSLSIKKGGRKDFQPAIGTTTTTQGQG
jgi:hypothetical protein